MLVNGIQTEQEIGYSGYYFDPEFHPIDFCVIGYVNDYFCGRLLVFLAITFLQFFIIFTVQISVSFLYNIKYNDLKGSENNSDAQYYIWSTAITVGLLAVIVYALDMYAMAYENKPSEFPDVTIYFVSGMVYLIFFPIINAIGCIRFTRHVAKRDFPIPCLVTARYL